MALWVLYPCQLVFRKHASWFTDCLRVVLSLTDRRRAVAVAWYDPSNVEKLDLAGGFVRWKSQPANVQKLVLQLFWLWFAKHGSSSFSFVCTVYSGGVKGRNCTELSRHFASAHETQQQLVQHAKHCKTP